MPSLPFHFVFLSVLEHGYQQHEAFGAGTIALGSLPAAERGSNRKSGLCQMMLQDGFVCGFPRQTQAHLPVSPSPPRLPARDAEQGSGHRKKAPNSLFNFVGSVKQSDVGRR